MVKLIIRILVSVIIALLFSKFGIIGNTTVLQTLFTVLGIVFSISMSLLVSFSLAKILNKHIRIKLRSSITHSRNMLLLDFIFSTICLVTTLIWNPNDLRYTYSYFTIDIMLLGVIIIASSLVYEIYNFRKLHKLHSDIEDAIISEETNRS